MGILQEVV